MTLEGSVIDGCSNVEKPAVGTVEAKVDPVELHGAEELTGCCSSTASLVLIFQVGAS